ncbi:MULTISPECIES: MFS transporter [unclassified Streptomyces]|uniref:MFS transporter n=1 Tax=unclassified Streptomyces TaxID=2593676 RepID=UPI00081F6A5B|nr:MULTISPECIES: MFS transporter [unclassified Streptomyces]SCF74592.1 Major Facilitator Superfamily protein [Streptomyces sp. MnatMP-M17]
MRFSTLRSGLSRSGPSSPHLFARVPLAGRYPAAVALSLLALSPYLILTTATTLMEPRIMRDLGATRFELQLTSGMSNAAYAFGAVAAADLVQRVARRHLYLICEAGFVVSSVLALSAPGIGLFMTGVILQGLCTGMLLVSALPPLVTGHPIERLATTAAVVSLGLFGMVAFGPLVGGLAGSLGGWRPLFAGIATLAAIGLTVGALAFEGNEPPARRARFDWLAIPLAFGTTALPFFGVAWLTRGSFGDPAFYLPVVCGLICGLSLVGGQYRKANPLMPVRPISNTLPVVGTVNAMLVGACFTALLELTESYLTDEAHYSPLRVGTLVTPQIVGIFVAAVLFRRLVATRWTPYLALSGTVSVAIGAAVLLAVSTANASTVVPVAALFLGFGAGAGVTPGLFLAGFSVPSAQIGPTFALVELLRSEAAFLVGPVLLHAALTTGLGRGFHLTVTITLAITVTGALFLVALYALGGARPQPPDLESWLSGRSTAYHSPPLAAAIRKN